MKRTSFVQVKKELTPIKENPGFGARWKSLKSPQRKRDQPARVQPQKEPKPEKVQAKKEQAKPEQAKKDQPARAQPKREPKPLKEQAKKEPQPEKSDKAKSPKPETPQPETSGKAKSPKPDKAQSPAMKSAMKMKRKKHGGKSKKHGSINKDADEKKESQPEEKVDGEAATDEETGSSPKKKKTVKDIGGRNARCKALMRYARAKKAIRHPKGKTFEQGDKNKIPQSLHARVLENPDDEFDKYFRNSCSWTAVLAEEKDENVNSTENTGKRTWVFADTLLNTTCGGNQARYTLMRNQLEKEGYHRYHPDMSRDWKGNETDEEKACALQFHALSLDEQTEVDMRKKTKSIVKRSGEGSPKKKALKLQAKTDSPSPTKKAKTGKEEEAATDAGKGEKAKGEKSKTSEKANGEKTSTKQDEEEQGKSAKEKAIEQKEKLKKEQEKKNKEQAKKADPLERAKSFMNLVPTLIRELRVAQSEVGQKKTKAHVPTRFLREYEHTVGQHLTSLVTCRNDMESSIGVDPKKFLRQVGGVERLDAADKEISTARKTLKSWRNAMHVYMNGVDGKEA